MIVDDHEIANDLVEISLDRFELASMLDKRCLHRKNSTQSIRSVLALLMANSVAASFEVWTRLGIQGQLLLQQLVAQEMPAKLRRNGYLVVECMILHCSLRHSATTTRCPSWVWASLFRAVLQRTLVVWFYAGIRANGITSAGGKALAKAHFMKFRVISFYYLICAFFCLKRLISLQSDFCSCEIFVLCDLCLGPRVSTCNAIEDVATVPTVATIGLLSKGGYWGCVFFVENLSIITWNWKKNRSFHPLIAHIISLMNVARHFGRTANCDRWTCA